MMTRSATLALLTLAAVAPSRASASDTVQVGGTGARACSNTSNPPTLADGVTLASADLDFAWDSIGRVLTLTVENTSAVDPGIPNPLITQVYFNLPMSAVSSVSLLTQTGAAGSPAPAFGFDYDPLPNVNQNLTSGCMGAFGARLSIRGIKGGIANASADLPGGPPGSAVVGPVIFEFAVDGPGVHSLTANTFASAFSSNPPGTYTVNASVHFQSGGLAGASDKLSNAPVCEPSGWMIGDLRIGQPVTFTMSSAQGCHGCLAYSFTMGTTYFGPLAVPLGTPMYPVFPGRLPASGILEKTVTLPNDPNLVGVTTYFAVITRSPGGMLQTGASWQATIGS